jgi:molybdate transport system substrate-binding protein
MLFLWLAVASLPALAGEVRVAVAANFSGPMQAIAKAFERESGHRAVVAVGSTGRFYAQVRNGAPFEVLLAADDETPARLEREGFGIAGTRITYATGRLVLWSTKPGQVDPAGEVLRSDTASRLAVADPRLSPYGAAALQVLDRLGLRAAFTARLVQGESIGQAFQFVASGNAPLGFVALSQVASEGRIVRGSGWIVPQRLHEPLRQDAIVLNPGRSNPAAAALLRFLQGDEARAIIRAHGYEI